MSNELPEPWAAALAPKGIHSYRDMAAAVGQTTHETMRRLCTGGATSAATVAKVADALFGGEATRVWSMYGVALEDFGPFELPAEARLLNDEQREAVRRVVLAMIPKDKRQGGGDGHAEDSRSAAPMKALTQEQVDLAAYGGGVDEVDPDDRI